VEKTDSLWQCGNENSICDLLYTFAALADAAGWYVSFRPDIYSIAIDTWSVVTLARRYGNVLVHLNSHDLHSSDCSIKPVRFFESKLPILSNPSTGTSASFPLSFLRLEHYILQSVDACDLCSSLRLFKSTLSCLLRYLCDQCYNFIWSTSK